MQLYCWDVFLILCCTWKAQGSFLSPHSLTSKPPQCIHRTQRSAWQCGSIHVTLSARSHASVPDLCLLGNMASQEMRQAKQLCWCSAQPPFPNAGCMPLDICLCYQGNHGICSSKKCSWINGFSNALLTHCWFGYCLCTIHTEIPFALCIFYWACPKFPLLNDN